MTPEIDKAPGEQDEYRQETLRSIREEVIRDLPIYDRVRFISFISYSNGRGRRRREGRQVELLVIDNTYAYVVDHWEVRARKHHDHLAIDVLANEVLSHLPSEERTVDKLLEIAVKNSRIRKK